MFDYDKDNENSMSDFSIVLVGYAYFILVDGYVYLCFC